MDDINENAPDDGGGGGGELVDEGYEGAEGARERFLGWAETEDILGEGAPRPPRPPKEDEDEDEDEVEYKGDKLIGSGTASDGRTGGRTEEPERPSSHLSTATKEVKLDVSPKRTPRSMTSARTRDAGGVTGSRFHADARSCPAPPTGLVRQDCHPVNQWGSYPAPPARLAGRTFVLRQCI